ncbi:MAG: UPF0158 family protein [Opitutaceae bacterium]|nr:UPF0158 family protein [Opitutaceae bacterium]
MRKLKVSWLDFETACDMRGNEIKSYVDLETGKVLVVMDEIREQLEELWDKAGADASLDDLLFQAGGAEWEKQALRDAWLVEQGSGQRVVSLPEPEPHEDFRDLEDFVATVQDPKVRAELEHALEGRGAFRRFRDVIHGTFRERQQWFKFKQQRLRERMTRWFASYDIEVEWVLPPPPPPETPVREHLLEGVLKFVRVATQLPGVKRIALVGSLTRDEPEPKDVDLLVTVADDMDLTPLASAGRKLGGHAQQRNRGSDVFLANERGEYIGRACPWRECAPGIRVRCDALNCGRRHYLHDDLRSVRLDAKLVAEPPIELWPELRVRVQVPSDVSAHLLAKFDLNRR